MEQTVEPKAAETQPVVVVTDNFLIRQMEHWDYALCYQQWRYASANNWYLKDAAGKWLSNRLDTFRKVLTAAERAEIEFAIDDKSLFAQARRERN